MIEKMFASLERFHPLTEEMKERLTSITILKEFPKKTILLREGQVSHNACFVLSGLSRAYYTSDGKEITTRFMDEGYIITSWLSYYTQKPGYEFVETLEACILGCLSYNDLQQLYLDFPAFNIVGRKVAEYFFFLSEQRTQLLRKHTAEEKYQFFIQQHPDLLQRIPLKYIATYLGMNEETLSRVRKKATRP
ncbi:MAG: Crp/Fnr family transcriptional regulator [Flavisolibacter sp.]|jgi:CRP-like cAMP-binding protein